MQRGVRQQGYTRRLSQQDHLEISRSQHEDFRSSIFSTARAPVAPVRQDDSHQPPPAGNTTSQNRIDAAIKAAMDADARRGKKTFHATHNTSVEVDSLDDSRSRGDQATGLNEVGALAIVQHEGGGAPAPGSWVPQPHARRTRSSSSRDSIVPRYPGQGIRQVPSIDDSLESASAGRLSGSLVAKDSLGSVGSGGVANMRQHQLQGPEDTRRWVPEPPPVPGESVEDNTDEGVRRVGSRQESRNDDEHNADSSKALEPTWSPDVPPPVKTGVSGGTVVDDGVNPMAKSFNEPLALPGGCHHISLAKFLEVMTGPGLRVRKHHRAGKGTSGLRVLRYSEEEDSLTWDSHKILGAAQHVLPMRDVEDVSMQDENRVVLMCVGGKDSYAVFEAANEDAAAVLYVGLKRLRERTQMQRNSV